MAKFGPLVIDIEGEQLSRLEKQILRHPQIGGVLLFSRNYANQQQLKALVAEIREASIQDLVIMVDHEGGRIWRFDTDFTKVPPARIFGRLYMHDANIAIEQAKNAGLVIASELLEVGIDLTLAPVLDLDWDKSTVIKDRSYHNDPDIVALLAKSFILGLREAGMAACGKHYPGHGGSLEDSHTEIAVDYREFDEIFKNDIKPFKLLAHLLKAIMPAHVIYSKVAPEPAGYSSYWLQDVLRSKLNFSGAIISDCLSMKSAAVDTNLLTNCMRALQAGCDLVIIANQDRREILRVADLLEWQLSSEQNIRVGQLCGRQKPVKAQAMKSQFADFSMVDFSKADENS